MIRRPDQAIFALEGRPFGGCWLKKPTFKSKRALSEITLMDYRMRLVIHGGLHKTATTSFQALCWQNRQVLFQQGIVYPEFRTWKQHGYAAWDLQRHKYRAVQKFLTTAAESSDADKTVLISGEDFENCLVDLHSAIVFQKAARKSGFTEISWCFVRRNPYDYLLSIYAELSKHRIVVDLQGIAACILKSGYFTTYSNKYNYNFVFDLKRRVNHFRQHVAKDTFMIEYADFIKAGPGLTLLERLAWDAEVIKDALPRSDNSPKKNVRQGTLETEMRYARTALSNSRDLGFNDVVEKLAELRHNENAKALPKIKEAFQHRFGSNTG